MATQSNIINYKNPKDFELIQKLRSNDSKTITDIFEARNRQYKKRFILCMARATGEERLPPTEWLQELKCKMMENNWGENVHEQTEKGETKKVGCWGSLLNFYPEKQSFEQWFVGDGKWYEETADCVAFRFFLIKAIMEKDSWATCYIFNLGFTNSIPGKSKMERIGRHSSNWKPPLSYYIEKFEKIIVKYLPEKITHLSFDEIRKVWGSDFWADLSGVKNDTKAITWRNLKKYDPTCALDPWLVKTASNFSIKTYIRKKNLLILLGCDDSAFLDNCELSQPNQDAIDDDTWTELILSIKKDIAESDQQTRIIIEEKMSNTPSVEIASKLGMTVSAIDTRFKRWKDKERQKYYNSFYYSHGRHE